MNEKHGQGTQCTKIGADKSAENIPNLFKFGLSMKKGFIGRP